MSLLSLRLVKLFAVDIIRMFLVCAVAVVVAAAVVALVAVVVVVAAAAVVVDVLVLLVPNFGVQVASLEQLETKHYEHQQQPVVADVADIAADSSN